MDKFVSAVVLSINIENLISAVQHGQIIMTLAAILLGFIVSTLYGSIFHLWRGGGAGRLLLYIILGWAGFWLGHFLGDHFGIFFLSIGSLRLGMATIGSFIFLVSGHWLSLVETGKT